MASQGSSEALCKVDAQMESDGLRRFIDCLPGGVPVFWNKNIAPLIGEQVRSSVKQKLNVEITTSCAAKPSADMGGTIRLDKTFIYYQLYFQQALALSLTGAPEFCDPTLSFKYLNDVLIPRIRAEYRLCRKDGAQSGGHPYLNVPSVAFGLMSNSEYRRMNERLRRQSNWQEFADYMLELPVSFVLAHEAAHLFLHPNGPDQSRQQEREADAFATDLLSSQNVLPLSMIADLLIFANASERGPNEGMACRITSILLEAPSPKWISDRLGKDALNRYLDLHVIYLAHFSQLCDEPF